jgi:hypothetical protein
MAEADTNTTGAKTLDASALSDLRRKLITMERHLIEAEICLLEARQLAAALKAALTADDDTE